MKSIYLFDSEKGGVGKSTFCKAFIHHLIDNDIEFKLFDADFSNQDVVGCYSDIGGEALDLTSDDKRSGEIDKIFQAGTHTDVVVNFPTNIAAVFNRWLSTTGVLEMQKSAGISFVKLFVMTADPQCVQALKRSLNAWGSKMRHVVVQNLDASYEEKYDEIFAEPELSDLVKRYSIPILRMPRLAYKPLSTINERQLRLDEAISEDSGIFILDRNRIKVWSRECSNQIEESGIIPAVAVKQEAKQTAKSR